MRMHRLARKDAVVVSWAANHALLVATVLLGISAPLAGCGPSLSNEFAALDAQKEPETAAGLSQATAIANKPAARAADKLIAVATPGNQGYKIGALDVVEFSVFKVPELARTAQVAETGTINLPLVGEVQAAGKTAQELERDLTRKLGAKYLQSPQVTVMIKEYNSQRVTVEGAVKKPGVYPIRGKTTLLQVIATAEGLDATVSDTTVVVFRQIDGKRSAAKFDVADIRNGTTPDPPLQSGDVVIAPSSATKETFNTILKALPLATVFALL
jgi:polysaccharide export outer membrane protein